jgi:hypothetical protein
MADALDRPISFEELDIRNGSVERVVEETQSTLRVVLGPINYERIRRSTTQRFERFPKKSLKSKLRSLFQSLSISVLTKSAWFAVKSLFLKASS